MKKHHLNYYSTPVMHIIVRPSARSQRLCNNVHMIVSGNAVRPTFHKSAMGNYGHVLKASTKCIHSYIRYSKCCVIPAIQCRGE